MEIADNLLFEKVRSILEQARKQVATIANLAMVHSYFEIGRTIVEEEQNGKWRATYGKKTLQGLSLKLTAQFGRGFSVDNLQNMRQFFLCYSKYETVFRIFQNDDNQIDKSEMASQTNLNVFQLSWSHYLILMRIENREERSFYEIEAKEQNWSISQLKRQYHSSLYERLALSKNKEEVKKLVQQGPLEIKHYEF